MKTEKIAGFYIPKAKHRKLLSHAFAESGYAVKVVDDIRPKRILKRIDIYCIVEE